MLGRYVRGLIFLVALMSTATWLGLTLIFRLPHALPIAITTGLLEIIPFLGPVLAGTIAAVVGLFYGGANMAVWIALFYLVLRQLEDQLVMPAVIGHAVELHPVVTIFAVLAGSALAGVLGALMAIPRGRGASKSPWTGGGRPGSEAGSGARPLTVVRRRPFPARGAPGLGFPHDDLSVHDPRVQGAAV